MGGCLSKGASKAITPGPDSRANGVGSPGDSQHDTYNKGTSINWEELEAHAHQTNLRCGRNELAGWLCSYWFNSRASKSKTSRIGVTLEDKE